MLFRFVYIYYHRKKYLYRMSTYKLGSSISLFAIFLILGTLFVSCQKYKTTNVANFDKNDSPIISAEEKTFKIKKDSIQQLFLSRPKYQANGFDFPVGKPNAQGYYNAQGFGENNHLGDDWNSVKGGNSDLGDPIYAIANGYVNFARDVGGGWGNVIRIWHQLDDKTIVESLYAHCDKILIKEERFVIQGEKIGTIGNAGGIYLAHLHFEIRDSLFLPIGKGYSVFTEGYLNPTLFIKSYR